MCVCVKECREMDVITWWVGKGHAIYIVGGAVGVLYGGRGDGCVPW